jgi:hypothetical protein
MNKFFTNRTRLYKFGIILTVLFSIIIGFLNVGVLFLFGIPVLGLILGLILIWFSKETLKLKSCSTIIQIPIIICSFFLMFWLNSAEPETFLIPQNFRGRITIFYEEPCGQKPIYENGRRIYKFPENGILISNFKRPQGYLNQEFYFVDEVENRTKIPRKDVGDFNFKGRLSKTETEPSRDEIGAFYAWGGLDLFLPSIKYNNFIIDSYRYFEKDEKQSWQDLQQFSKKTKNLLIECRKKT